MQCCQGAFLLPLSLDSLGQMQESSRQKTEFDKKDVFSSTNCRLVLEYNFIALLFWILMNGSHLCFQLRLEPPTQKNRKPLKKIFSMQVYKSLSVLHWRIDLKLNISLLIQDCIVCTKVKVQWFNPYCLQL